MCSQKFQISRLCRRINIYIGLVGSLGGKRDSLKEIKKRYIGIKIKIARSKIKLNVNFMFLKNRQIEETSY